MSRDLVTYIILGSRDRLKNIKIPQSSSTEEYIPANLEINGNSEKIAQGETLLIPASNKEVKLSAENCELLEVYIK